MASVTNASAVDFLLAAGVDPQHDPLTPGLLKTAKTLLAQRGEPDALVVECLKSSLQAARNRQNCAAAADAAENLEQMLKELLTGHASLCRMELVRHTPGGPLAVCRAGGQMREFPVHPDVAVEELETLQPWEYVRVQEDVVIGVWRGDRVLHRVAQGEVVEFREYANREEHLVRVARHGHDEEVAMLAEPLQGELLAPGAKLVLQRDQPHWAIAAVSGELTRSRFEVPLEAITTRLEDLAGMDALAERLVMDVLKRVIYPEIRDDYDLDPLKGMLLLSRKPGMGKTTFVRAFARFLGDVGMQSKFDVVLYHVKPNETKSMWHGEDSRIIREDLFGCIHARREKPREQPLFQLLVIDEIDSLGRRPGNGEVVNSAAQSDALESILVELDGLVQDAVHGGSVSHLLVIGMSNRPDRIDDAMKRPGRLGDLVLEIDALSQSDAEAICAIYGRHAKIPWQLNGKACQGAATEELVAKMIRPAMSHVFPLNVLRYYSDTQQKFDVRAGDILAGAHYRSAMNHAKTRAAERRLLGTGNPAVTYDDLLDGLVEGALSVARQMAADPHMLMRHLDIKVPVGRVEVVPREELETHRFLRSHVG